MKHINILPTNAHNADILAVDYPAAFNNFLAEIDVKAKTKQAYKKAFFRFMEFKAVNAGTLTGRRLMLAYKEHLKSKYAPATCNLYISGLKSFSAWLETAGICPDFAKSLKSVKDSRDYKRDELTRAEISRILASIDRASLTGKRNYALIAVLLTTGIRTISAAIADVSDVDFSRGVLCYQGKGREAKTDRADLPETVLKAIQEYHAAAGITAGALFQSLGRVKETAGRRLPPESISHIVKGIFRAAGIDSDRLTAHSLRHTFATTLHRAGIALESIAAKLGHASTETTKKYVHLANQNDLKAGEIVAGALL